MHAQHHTLSPRPGTALPSHERAVAGARGRAPRARPATRSGSTAIAAANPPLDTCLDRKLIQIPRALDPGRAGRSAPATLPFTPAKRLQNSNPPLARPANRK